MAVQVTRRRFTVTDYDQMLEAGILGEDDRVELIDGEVIEMTPIGRRHAGCVNRLAEHFMRRFADAALTIVQNPIRLGEYAEPQPDLALVRRRSDFYASGHPTPADILLVVEVAETSANLDRQVKVPLYARSGIPELWLVDLDQETVTVYRDPAPGGYASARVARRGGSLAPVAFPDRELSATDILG